MNRFFLFCLVLLAVFSLSAQSSLTAYYGKQADAYVPGAKEVTLYDHIPATAYIHYARPVDVSVDQLEGHVKELMKLDRRYSLQYLKEGMDKSGRVHRRYHLYYNNVIVEDAMLVFHLQPEGLVAINGVLYSGIVPANEIVISAEHGRSMAIEEVGAEKYRWELPEEEAHLKWETGNPEASYFPEGRLVLIPLRNDEEATHRYAWEFDLYTVLPTGRHLVYVDAASGEILRNLDMLFGIDVPGTAVTYYSGTQAITTDSTGVNYRLRETGRGNGIETYNMQQGTSYASAVDFTDDDNYWNNVNAQLDQVATDAHWGAEMTYDYFYHYHNRNSIDDNGFALRSYVHYDVSYANAFWDGYRMTYGDGSGSMGPLVALDIVAHEISHGLTSYTANLVYAYESGALNEAFSDIFGTAVEFYAKPSSANWLIGENIGIVIRSMANPKLYSHPDTYLGTNWYTGSGDNGGVHTNSGVLNYWFYRLTVGGSGINDLGNAYNVTGLGIVDAAKVAYRMLNVYLTPNSQYADARFYGIKSAVDLFGACSPEVESVTNAFYAIGVGPPYYNGVLADFAASDTVFCSLPAEVRFNNTSVNGLNFEWHFGDGNTSQSADPVHFYNSPGLYAVSLIADGGICGADTLQKVAFINVDPPSAPQVSHAEHCGPAILTLTASGTDSIYWYAPGNVLLHQGDTFQTPLLTQSAVYYAYNVQESPAVFGGKYDNTGSGGYFTSSNSHHLEFNASGPGVIKSVKVYASTPGNRTIQLQNGSGTVLVSKTVNIPVGESRITLDFSFSSGNGFKLVGPGSPNLYRNSGGTAYPYVIGNLVTITGSSAWTNPTGYYYYFYDWEVQGESCISQVVPVYASINTDEPLASFTYSQLWDTLLFQNTSQDANSYFWDFGDGNTSLEENPSHLYDTSGVYDVKMIAFNGCGADSLIQQIGVIITSDKQQEAEELKLYPNPAREWVYLEGLRLEKNTRVRLLNMNGMLMREWMLDSGDRHQIETYGLPKGVYVIDMIHQNRNIRKKLILY
jgi:Zn-dependent metalloprotease